MAHKKNGLLRLLDVGVGGQGVIRATQILGWAGINDNMVVRTAETHGMAQRGGSVVCYMGFGDVDGPLIPRGTADVIVAYEESEVLRYLDYANENTLILISKTRIIPNMIKNKPELYPKEEDIVNTMKSVSKNIHLIDTQAIATEAGERHAENVVLIAYLFASGKLPVSKEALIASISKFVPKKAIDGNMKAFELGLQYAKKEMSLEA